MNIKKQNIIFFILLLFTFLSCGKNPTLNLGYTFKPLPNSTDVANYVLNTASATSDTTPNIYLFIFEALRDESINGESTPNMLSFKNKYFTPEKSYSGATATHMSFYSIFFARPAHERIPMVSANWQLGSIPLKILVDKFGYKIRVFGYPDYFFKLDSGNSLVNLTTGGLTNPIAEEGQMQLLFGANTTLASTGTIPDRALNSTYGSTIEVMDHTVITNLLSSVDANATSDKNIFITYLYGAHHHPYFWSDTLTNVITPNTRTYGLKDMSNYDFTSYQKLVESNSYQNALAGYDYQFGRFLDYLKTKGTNQSAFKNSIIVFTGDHGKYLFQNGDGGHGRYPYRSVIRVPLTIKFLNNDSTTLRQSVPKLGTHQDIFPTIMSYMGIQNYGQPFYYGERLDEKTNTTHMLSKPNWGNPADVFALVGENYKVILKPSYVNGDITTTSSFEIFEIKDLDDNIIQIAPTLDQTIKKIKTDFRETLKKVFTNVEIK